MPAFGSSQSNTTPVSVSETVRFIGGPIHGCSVVVGGSVVVDVVEEVVVDVVVVVVVVTGVHDSFPNEMFHVPSGGACPISTRWNVSNRST